MPSDNASKPSEIRPRPGTETDTGERTESTPEPAAEDQNGSEPVTKDEGGKEPEGEGQAQNGVGSEPLGKVKQAAPHKVGKPNWRNRTSLRVMRREALMSEGAWDEFDKRENDASRLRLSEEVRLGGLILAEAFTPSTISALKRAVADFPGNNARKAEWLANLEQGRSTGGSGGWTNLGSVRRPGAFGIDNFDPEIPEAVNAIWPVIFSLTPSLTIVVATFTIKDEYADLSSILRTDHKTSAFNPHLRVQGRLGWVRQHIPWARPKSYMLTHGLRRPDDEKRLACEASIADLEKSCWNWFNNRFPGRFSREDRENRPTCRMLFTNSTFALLWLADDHD